MQIWCGKCNAQHDDEIGCLAEHFLPEQPNEVQPLRDPLMGFPPGESKEEQKFRQMQTAIDNRIRIWDRGSFPDGPGQQSKFLHRLEFLMRDLENIVGFQAQGAADGHTQLRRKAEES